MYDKYLSYMQNAIFYAYIDFCSVGVRSEVLSVRCMGVGVSCKSVGVRCEVQECVNYHNTRWRCGRPNEAEFQYNYVCVNSISF